MGDDPDREQPFFFDKPTDALIAGETDIPFQQTDQLEQQVELADVLGGSGRDVDPAAALDIVWGHSIINTQHRTKPFNTNGDISMTYLWRLVR